MSRRSRWLRRKLAHSLFALPLVVVGWLLLDADRRQSAMGGTSGGAQWLDGAGLILLLFAIMWLIGIWWACE